MFVGHALLGFALAAFGGRLAGLARERALIVGSAAAAFGAIPDIDIVYAPVGLLAAGSPLAVDAFWRTGNVVHRSVTHSLPVGVVLAVAVGLWTLRVAPGRRGPVAAAVGLAAGGAVIGTAFLVSPALSGSIAALYVLAAFAVATLAAGRGLTPREVFGTAAVGLLAHPFGDLFAGEPPPLFYPFDLTVLGDRVVLSADPTLHLLGTFGLELAVIWFAVAVYVGLTGQRVWGLVGKRAALGVAYAGAVAVVPPPTVESSYQFVFSVLGVGALGIAGRDHRRRVGRLAIAGSRRAVVTGLAAVTVAWLSYAGAYLVVR